MKASPLKSARFPIRAMPAGLVMAVMASSGAAVTAPAMPFWVEPIPIKRVPLVANDGVVKINRKATKATKQIVRLISVLLLFLAQHLLN
jgi:hypothetical protein